MKKIVLAALAVILAVGMLTGCNGDSQKNSSVTPTSDQTAKLSGTVKTGGSTSVEKVMNALIFKFQDDNREVTINYEMNGSGDGIKNASSGMYEIGHSSRELKTDGTEDGLNAIPYAIDGIAVIMHKNNAVENLSKEQIKDIYTGKVKNWSEVGGNDALITVVTREASSGTRSAFAEIIGIEKKGDDETKIVAEATTCDSTGAVQTNVAQNENAIGYMSFSDVDDTKVSVAKFENIQISEATLKGGSYALKRDFYIVTKKGAELSPEGKAFMDFVLGDAGQGIVKDNKLLPIK